MQEHNSKEALIANLKMRSKTATDSSGVPGTNLVCCYLLEEFVRVMYNNFRFLILGYR